MLLINSMIISPSFFLYWVNNFLCYEMVLCEVKFLAFHSLGPVSDSAVLALVRALAVALLTLNIIHNLK